ncbi:PIN domain-containing protein [Pseudomonas sp. YJ42]|uniref:PIN domain-containing protein n=1 Tax=Pseudomonas sp. YJ42 TaxID=3392115 RepID=UPI0039A0EEC6
MSDDNELRSGLVFIDTSSFQSKQFQFGQHILEKIEEFLEKGHIRILLPEVIDREITKHISLKLDESIAALKKIRKEHVFLRNLPNYPCSGIFSDIDKSEALNTIYKKYEKFKSYEDVEILPTNLVDSKLVFDRYFSGKPPFQNSGKKHEFPDAFALEAIRITAENRLMPVYVISNDSDMREYCDEFPDSLIYLEKIEDLVGLVNRYTEELAQPTKLAVGAFENIKTKVIEALENIFKDADYSCDDLNDSDYEITELDVQQVEIASYNVIDASTENSEIQLTVNLQIAATYSIIDYDNSPWDPEDKAYAYLDSYELTKVHHQTYQAYLFISFDSGIKANAEITEIWLDDSTLELTFKPSESHHSDQILLFGP